MAHYEIILETDSSELNNITQKFEALKALAITFYDAKDEPILEPLPGETPIWQKVKVVGLFDIDSDLEKIKIVFKDNDIKVQTIEDKNWVKECLKYFKPIKFANNFWVCPSWEPNPQKDATILKLDPGLAFGTGTHPTTSLCLQYLAQNPPKDLEVIDYGCGSGILAIAACLLGAKKVWAVDHCLQALVSTRNNAKLNNIKNSQITICTNEELAQKNIKASLIIANILADTLIDIAPKLSNNFADNNCQLVLSGILENQVTDVTNAYSKWFKFAPINQEEEWVQLVGKKVKTTLINK